MNTVIPGPGRITGVVLTVHMAYTSLVTKRISVFTNVSTYTLEQ